jgi:hypothetical protein
MNKKYKTRDGRDVRLLCIDGPGEYPVIGIINNEDLGEWTSLGRYFPQRPSEHPSDLIEVPNTITKTFYRRKWFLNRKQELVRCEYPYYSSKEVFDNEYAVKDHSGTWSDEWEEITVEVPNA